METQTSSTIIYRDYTITPGGLRKFQFISNEYTGDGDNRFGHCDTIEECKSEVDEQVIESLMHENNVLKSRIEKLMKHIDADAEVILKASLHFEDHKKDRAKLTEMLNASNATVEIMRGFVENYLTMFEKKFESDEKEFTYEQMDQYVTAAGYLQNKFDVIRFGRIRRVLERMNALPY
jgi:hypothetical protein